jgi:hypothetical protein
MCKIDDGICRGSIETVIVQYLSYNVQHVSALSIDHSEERVRIYKKFQLHQHVITELTDIAVL